MKNLSTGKLEGLLRDRKREPSGGRLPLMLHNKYLHFYIGSLHFNNFSLIRND